MVAGAALKVLHKMISSHHVTAEDFVEQSYQLPGGGVVKLPQQPGHALLMHMMNDSILFRKVETYTQQHYQAQTNSFLFVLV